MPSLKKHTKRILTDTAGYGLLVAAVLASPIPGPGGIPLAAAGLGLLSIHNAWAQRLRDYFLANGGKLAVLIFPKHPVAQWAYDIVAIVLYILCAYLAWHHAAYWQIGVAVSAFFLATTIALMNRERMSRLKNRRKSPKP